MGKSFKNRGINAPHLEADGQFPKLKPSTIQKGIQSREEALHRTRRIEKTHPMSKKPNFGPLRHDSSRPGKAIVKHGEQILQSPESTPLKQGSSGSSFETPKGTQWYPRNEIKNVTPGGTQHAVTELGRTPQKMRTHSRQIDFDEAVMSDEVTLNYHHLKKPKGLEKRINNNAIQGGSAKSHYAQEREHIRKYLAENTDSETVDAYIKALNESRFEHTHHISAHFGITQNEKGELIHPGAPAATSPMPAAFNSSMMLLEKFADYLLFSNHHQHGFGKRQDSIKMGYRGAYIPGTRCFAWFEFQITDLRTGNKYSQRWDAPMTQTKRPSLAGYCSTLSALKADHQQWVPVTTADRPQQPSSTEADPVETSPTQQPKRPRHK